MCYFTRRQWFVVCICAMKTLGCAWKCQCQAQLWLLEYKLLFPTILKLQIIQGQVHIMLNKRMFYIEGNIRRKQLANRNLGNLCAPCVSKIAFVWEVTLYAFMCVYVCVFPTILAINNWQCVQTYIIIFVDINFRLYYTICTSYLILMQHWDIINGLLLQTSTSNSIFL